MHNTGMLLRTFLQYFEKKIYKIFLHTLLHLTQIIYQTFFYELESTRKIGSFRLKATVKIVENPIAKLLSKMKN